MHATDGGLPIVTEQLPLECPTAKRKVHTGVSRVYRCIPRRPSARKVSSDHPKAQLPFILRSVSAAPSPFPCPAYLRLPSAPSLPVRCHPSQPIAILLHSALVPGPGAATAGTQQSRSATRNHPAFSLPAIPFVPARQERSSHTGGPDRQSRQSPACPLSLSPCATVSGVGAACSGRGSGPVVLLRWSTGAAHCRCCERQQPTPPSLPPRRPRVKPQGCSSHTAVIIPHPRCCFLPLSKARARREMRRDDTYHG